MTETDFIPDENIQEYTYKEEILNELESPTVEYVWKGSRFKKDKQGHRIPREPRSIIIKDEKTGELLVGKQFPKRRGVILATVIGNKVGIGFSLCNLKYDEFDHIKGNHEPGFGLSVAAERAEKWLDRRSGSIIMSKMKTLDDVVNIPQSIASKLIAFVERCKEFKRYEGLEFPSWVKYINYDTTRVKDGHECFTL